MKECYLISRISWTRDEEDGTVICAELRIFCQLTIYFFDFLTDWPRALDAFQSQGLSEQQKLGDLKTCTA